MVNDPTPDGWPNGGTDEDPHPKERRGKAPLLEGKGFKENGLRGRQQRAATDSLDKPKCNELPNVMRVAAGDRSTGKKEDRSDVISTAPKTRSQETRNGNNDDIGDRVRRYHPGHIFKCRAQVPAYVIQGDIYDRGIDEL